MNEEEGLFGCGVLVLCFVMFFIGLWVGIGVGRERQRGDECVAHGGVWIKDGAVVNGVKTFCLVNGQPIALTGDSK